MAEYIEREAAIRALCDGCVDDGYCGEKDLADRYACDDVPKLLAIPAADVREVKRGEWLTGNGNPRSYGRIRAMCGRCGAFALYEMVNAGSYKEQLSKFCPSCGAEMREPPKEG